MSQEQPFIWKSYCKQLEWAYKQGGMEPQGISRAVQTTLATDGVSIWHPPASSVALSSVGFRKGAMASAHDLSVREKAVPQLSPWCQILQFLPVCHWCLSSCHHGSGAQGKWVRVSRCVYFRKNCLGFQPFLPLTQSSLVIAARSYGDLSSWHWNSVLEDLLRGWDS